MKFVSCSLPLLITNWDISQHWQKIHRIHIHKIVKQWNFKFHHVIQLKSGQRSRSSLNFKTKTVYKILFSFNFFFLVQSETKNVLVGITITCFCFVCVFTLSIDRFTCRYRRLIVTILALIVNFSWLTFHTACVRHTYVIFLTKIISYVLEKKTSRNARTCRAREMSQPRKMHTHTNPSKHD